MWPSRRGDDRRSRTSSVHEGCVTRSERRPEAELAWQWASTSRLVIEDLETIVYPGAGRSCNRNGCRRRERADPRLKSGVER